MPGPLSSLYERIGGSALFALSLPVVAASGIVTFVLSKRSPFVAHLRVGQHGKPLWVWKLRTMWDNGPVAGTERGWVEYIVAEPQDDWKDRADQRVRSRFAAFCRRHSIDELPQLAQVALGELSLIGPRPLTRTEIGKHYGDRADELLSVKPGLTGLWQVRGRSELNWRERVSLDLELVRNPNWRIRAEIAARTAFAVMTGKGAW